MGAYFSKEDDVIGCSDYSNNDDFYDVNEEDMEERCESSEEEEKNEDKKQIEIVYDEYFKIRKDFLDEVTKLTKEMQKKKNKQKLASISKWKKISKLLDIVREAGVMVESCKRNLEQRRTKRTEMYHVQELYDALVHEGQEFKSMGKFLKKHNPKTIPLS